MRRPAPSIHRRALLTGTVLAVLACLVFAGAAAAKSRLYWTNNASGTIATANRAGGEVIQKLFFASPEPYGIAADATHVYWTDEGTDEIGRAELSGGNVEASLIPAGGEVPEGMAIAGGHIYWANLVGQAIGRANLDGSDPEPKFIQLSAASFPEGVAIEGSHIYWASAGHGGEIGRSNLSGGEVDEALITGLGGAISALAADSTHLYWSTNVGVGRAKLDGTEVEPSLVTGQTSVGGVAVDDEHVFWASFTTNRIGRAELDGGNVEPAFITGAESPDTITVSKNVTTIAGGTSNASLMGGESVHGTATVGGGETTSGTIAFALYGPGDETCAAAPLETVSTPVAGNGSYESPAVTPKAAGTYHWVARYGGDAINDPSSSSCAAGAFTVTKNATTTGGGAPPAGVTVGESVHGTATVSGGGGTPGGTVDFSLYGPGDETCAAAPLDAFAVPVTGNGSYASPSVTPTAPGTYNWVARYSGDAINAPSASTCSSGAFTVKAAAVAPTRWPRPVSSPEVAASPVPTAPLPAPALMTVTRDRNAGTGTISLQVPTAGTLTITSMGVEPVQEAVSAAGMVDVHLTPRGGYAARLRVHHRGFIQIAVAFEPRETGMKVEYQRRVRLVKR